MHADAGARDINTFKYANQNWEAYALQVDVADQQKVSNGRRRSRGGTAVRLESWFQHAISPNIYTLYREYPGVEAGEQILAELIT